jgi:CRISPR-associated endonuclease Cas1
MSRGSIKVVAIGVGGGFGPMPAGSRPLAPTGPQMAHVRRYPPCPLRPADRTLPHLSAVPQKATQLASGLLWSKILNQQTLLRTFEPRLPEVPPLKESSFQRILRLEAVYARTFWARYFRALSDDLFTREKRKPSHPLNIALSYGYGVLYHAVEWQALACGLDSSVGIVHRLRRSRPNLACDLIEPLRCCVELTVVRHLEEMDGEQRPALMAARFAEMMERKWRYREGSFRLRSIIRLMTESLVRDLHGKGKFDPFVLSPGDALV